MFTCILNGILRAVCGVNVMDGDQIFEMLVQYQIQRGIDGCKNHTRDGRVINPKTNKPFVEGGKENTLQPGLLIISNGDTLVDKLVDGGLANPSHIERFTEATDQNGFFEYLDRHGDEDGVHLYDGVNERIARVYLINNSPLQGLPPETLMNRLPSDFVYADGSPFSRGKIGTKTALAVELPIKFPTLSCHQIKQTPYALPGMGKVTYFNKGGLVSEFFLDLDSNQRLVGVRRHYEGVEDRIESRKLSPLQFPQQRYEPIRHSHLLRQQFT